MKEIQLSQHRVCENRGKYVALVDDEDFEYLNQFKWCAMKGRSSFYAVRKIGIIGKKHNQSMHVEILNGKGIDHIDHNGLNNQKSNLRLCSQSENCMNTKKRENTSSIYKGVSFHNCTKKWLAQISINGRHIHIGLFVSEIEAAKAYNKKAIELFCEFANLNIIDK